MFDVNKEIMKAALVGIDIEALAKKFKPLIEKQLLSDFSDFIKNYGFNEDVFYEVMDEYSKKIIEPELKKKLGLTTTKRK